MHRKELSPQKVLPLLPCCAPGKKKTNKQGKPGNQNSAIQEQAVGQEFCLSGHTPNQDKTRGRALASVTLQRCGAKGHLVTVLQQYIASKGEDGPHLH